MIFIRCGLPLVLAILLPMAGLSASDPHALSTRPDADRLARQAVAQMGKPGKNDEVVRWLEQAVALDPSNTRLRLLLGDAYGLKAQAASILTKMSWAGKCRKAYERVLEMEPDSIQALQRLINYSRQAPGIAGGGEDKARAYMTRLTQVDPYIGEMQWADFHRSAKRPGEAAAACRRAIAARPEEPTPRIVLSYCLEALGQMAEARVALLGVLKKQPDHFDAHYALGRLAAISGQELEAGWTHLDRYLELDGPDNPTRAAAANWRKGMIMEQLGRVDAARAAYRQALTLDPRSQEARAALRKLGP